MKKWKFFHFSRISPFILLLHFSHSYMDEKSKFEFNHRLSGQAVVLIKSYIWSKVSFSNINRQDFSANVQQATRE